MSWQKIPPQPSLGPPVRLVQGPAVPSGPTHGGGALSSLHQSHRDGDCPGLHGPLRFSNPAASLPLGGTEARTPVLQPLQIHGHLSPTAPVICQGGAAAGHSAPLLTEPPLLPPLQLAALSPSSAHTGCPLLSVPWEHLAQSLPEG